MLKNQMDAEDVTQEVFIKLWQRMNEVKTSKLGSWIMKTTRNLCIDYLRKRKTVINGEKKILQEKDKEEKTINLAAQFETKVVTEKVRAVISDLPELWRSVFVLYEIQNFKYREISEMLSVPVNSVKVYLFRARNKIREEILKNDKVEV